MKIISRIYQKIVYQRYEDGTFTRHLPHPVYLGYFGPVLAAEVGDVIIVSLKNMASKPVSITSNGVQIADDRSLYILILTLFIVLITDKLTSQI